MTERFEIVPPHLAALNPDRLLQALIISATDFTWFGGNGSDWTIIPIGIKPYDFREFLDRKLSSSRNESVSSHALPFTGGFIGMIPYDTFSPFTDGIHPVILESIGALLLNKRSNEMFIAAANPSTFQDVKKEAIALINAAKDVAISANHFENASMQLTAHETDIEYESMVSDALEDIRNGRYYQINLLRYFNGSNVSRTAVGNLLLNRGGPFSSWFHINGSDVISFSPEQFVATTPYENQLLIETSPIKGTAARSSDPTTDQIAAAELEKSGKNLAELHMIVDLMRNDLNRICNPGSVLVREANRLASFINVHHLVAEIEGVVKADLTIGEFLAAMCPGGSITGAPKIEVMHAIRSFEKRPRGFFMGQAFMLDASGRYNSSVLIRTLTRSSGNEYEFSAGSGIVINSDPKTERLEIDAKCNVLRP